ncbi:hypothetical protein CDG79_00505 [Nostoc sp. 'Peltigera membranacea cyanobiont' 232]|nr:hypothetical protein CDG79_00505 [Nostoc sp. 'Peltigera membranacea cyanobiont' 232]
MRTPVTIKTFYVIEDLMNFESKTDNIESKFVILLVKLLKKRVKTSQSYKWRKIDKFNNTF